MSTPIAQYGALKSLAGSFLETVSYYLITFLPYHTAFKAAAAGILIPVGILWIAVQTFKLPANKGASALGGLLLLMFCVFLLGPKTDPSKMFNGSTPPANTSVAMGSYWSFVLPAEIYTVFKRALTSVDAGSAAKDSALELAYDVNTKKVATKWDGSGLQDAYIQYVTQCTAAVKREVNSDADISSLGHVGLLGGSGIGYTARDHWSILAALDQFNSTSSGMVTKDTPAIVKASLDVPIVGFFVETGLSLQDAARAAWNADDIEEGIAAGKEILRKIPEDGNPFKDVAGSFPSGFRIETKDAWMRKYKIPGAPDGTPDLYDGSTVGGGEFKNPAVVTSGSSTKTQNPAFYPENCLEAFEMVNLGVAAYREAILESPEYKGKTKTYASVAPLHELAALMETHRQKAEAALSRKDYVTANSAPLSRQDDIASRINSEAIALFGMTQSVGAAISEWMLQVKMPFFVSTISMMCAGLITAFPLFIIISVFLGPKILISHIKLVIFCFLVILLNETFLSMGANLIATSNQLDLVYRIGNIARNNNALELSSATAEVVIFTSLMAIEVIIAKMLIWDDVKGMTSFNPGEGGAAATQLGMRAFQTAASIAAFPLTVKSKLASAAATKASTAASKSTVQLNNMLKHAISNNGGDVRSAINTMASSQRNSDGKNQSSPVGSTGTGVGRKRGALTKGDDGGPSLVPNE